MYEGKDYDNPPCSDVWKTTTQGETRIMSSKPWWEKRQITNITSGDMWCRKKWWDDVKVENITMKSEWWGLNMYVRSKTHDVSNHSMQALKGLQPDVIGKWGDERKGYRVHVRLKGLAIGNSICKGDKVNRLMKWWTLILWSLPWTSYSQNLTWSILKTGISPR